jgi:hypothetical protein
MKQKRAEDKGVAVRGVTELNVRAQPGTSLPFSTPFGSGSAPVTIEREQSKCATAIARTPL